MNPLAPATSGGNDVGNASLAPTSAKIVLLYSRRVRRRSGSTPALSGGVGTVPALPPVPGVVPKDGGEPPAPLTIGGVSVSCEARSPIVPVHDPVKNSRTDGPQGAFRTICMEVPLWRLA